MLCERGERTILLKRPPYRMIPSEHSLGDERDGTGRSVLRWKNSRSYSTKGVTNRSMPTSSTSLAIQCLSHYQVMRSAPRYGCIKRTEADRIRR